MYPITWWYFVIGTLGGVLAGMGMGGGTVFIPLITLVMGVGQIQAQAINLVAFLPAGVISLIVHLKNKLVNVKNTAYILVPAIVTTIAFSFVAVNTNPLILKKVFGYFLILIATTVLCQEGAKLVKKIIGKKREKLNKTNNIKL